MCAWLTPTCFPGRGLSSGRASHRCQVKVVFLPCLLRDPRPPFPEVSPNLWCLTVKHLGPKEGMWPRLTTRSEGMRRTWLWYLQGDPLRCGGKPVAAVHSHKMEGSFGEMSLVTQMVKNLPAMRETQVGSLGSPGEWHPTPVFLPGEFHGQKSLTTYSPRGHKGSDMTEINNTQGNFPKPILVELLRLRQQRI